MAPVVERSARDEVAVGQENGKVAPGGANRGGVPGEHVRAVRKEGDSPEVFRLALGAQDPVRLVEALEGGVSGGKDAGADGQAERGLAAGLRTGARAGSVPGLEKGRGDDKRALVQSVVVRQERPSVQRRAHQLERGAVEDQRGIGRRAPRAAHLEGRSDEALVAREVEVELDRVEEEGRRGVVLEPYFVRFVPGGGSLGHDAAPRARDGDDIWPGKFSAPWKARSLSG